ncbi:ABC transporter ATP-binding protein [Hypericibacter adhaerens]|uniref:ABC transporter ATP-binding protein n=1 Tax=Hypericibacter adhaerens TaxID=2602016 RepID=A0A5J6N1D7_9PROT|nr:ATP-binding cassette domain-containing protein [Hypericibacter adhaerens]QEX22823.1 ABC transporter ATP-binding protein [Hypericibacter adhaerens]
MTEPLAVIEGLTRRFEAAGRPALKDITARIMPGQVTGLVGPDGAGKTTLLRLVAGLLLPSEGKLTVCGHDTASDPQALRQDIGYMPQRFGLYEDLTVAENLDLYADLRGVVGPLRTERFERLLGFTGLARFTRRLAGRLSGGMKQKLGLACALLQSPKLLLLDEPSVGVDPLSRRELWRMVYELVDQGIGVVWSTAYLDEAELCAEVLLLNDGQLMFQGDPRRMTAEVEGRVFLVQGLAQDRRALLARMARDPAIADGVIQGESVRIVMRKPEPPTRDELGLTEEARLVPTAPRFEDAFVTALGGQSHHIEVAGLAGKRDGNGEVAVKAEGLTKRFGAFLAANAISFSIRRGEVFGLLGPNGAGKSTTFKMLCGLLRPNAGKAEVDGHDLYRAAAAARGRLGYMAQKFSLYGDLSVRQNLEFFAGVYGLRRAERRGAVARMIEAFDFKPHLERNAGELPLGFKQRLALACAVMHRPAVLFLDEPTSGVDPLTRREFWGFINGMVGQGVTVLVTTHFMDEAEYCDRIALINRGEVVALDSPDQLKRAARTAERPDPTLEDAFIALLAAQDEKEAA